MNHRVVGAIVSVIALAVTALPMVRDPFKGDDFPLSTYPMFAAKRKLQQSFTYAVGKTATDERRRIKPRHVANAEVMQAVMAFSTARSKGRLPALCKSIASRVAGDRRLTDVVKIEIVTGTHDAIPYLTQHVHGPERKLTSCEVAR